MKNTKSTSAQSFLMAAIGHTSSAACLQAAADRDPDNSIYSASMWFLMGWAVELSLKAAILHFGGNEADCKKAGHNLSAALAKATNYGYVSRLANLQNLVNDLNVTHQNHYFRYMPESDTEVPGDSTLALAVLRDLIREVASYTSNQIEV